MENKFVSNFETQKIDGALKNLEKFCENLLSDEKPKKLLEKNIKEYNFSNDFINFENILVENDESFDLTPKNYEKNNMNFDNQFSNPEFLRQRQINQKISQILSPFRKQQNVSFFLFKFF